MESFDWRLPIKRNIVLLKFVGLWPSGDESYKFNFYTVYAVVSLTLFVFGHNLTQTLNLLFVYNDLTAIIQTIFVSLTFSSAIPKVYYLVHNMKTLKQLLTTINSDLFQVKNQRQLTLVESSVDFWKTVYNMYSLMTLVTLLFWGLSPIILYREEHKLPVLAWYPYDYKTSPYYEITYVYQLASSVFNCAVTLNIDTLIAALNMLVGAQCDILCDNLRHIRERNLRDCIKHHKAILSFAEKSNRFFNWIVLVQFFTSVISISMTMFQLTTVPMLGSEFISYMLYGNAVLIQIFMYCWFGNEVETKSENIPYAAFESDWSGASLNFKKNLVLIILRSQRPIKVSALKLFYLSLETFMMILRTSWSYFAVLKQVNADV